MRKRPGFTRFAAGHAKKRLQRQFLDVRAVNEHHLLEQLEKGPFVLAANHVCWWDPLVLLWMGQVYGMDGFCLMDQAQMDKLPFFSALGALPINTQEPRRAALDLRSAARLLDRPRRVVAIFPQGQQRPFHLPLQFKPGVTGLSRLAQAPVLPLSMRYDFHEGPRAIVHICFNAPHTSPRHHRHEFPDEVAQSVRLGLAHIDDALRGTEPARSLLYPSPPSFDAERLPWGTRLLNLLFGGRG